MTFDEGILDEIRRTVDAGRAPSQRRRVQEAVVAYIARLDREALRAAYAAAAADPEFIAESELIMREFAPLDEEVELE